MAEKKPVKKTDAAKNAKKAERKRVEVKDLNTKKNPKGGPEYGIIGIG